MKNKLCLFFFISQALHTAPLSPKPISLEDLEKFIKCRIILELMNRNSISPETLEILQEEKEKLNCAGLEHEKFVAYLKLENEVSMLKKELEQDLYTNQQAGQLLDLYGHLLVNTWQTLLLCFRKDRLIAG